ncbi:MAG: DUF1499 domain-containing protein [Burkholderiales bacterium]|nr:DUF1499 domain-containing protein [Burkholderiales bacterium]
MWSWKRPGNLGVHDGRLAPCRRTPNCVSSQAEPADRVHAIEPIAFAGAPAEAMAALRRIVEAAPGARVVRARDDYLYAEFRSRVMRFVDDVEFALDAAQGVIHVRSASRVGIRDFGVNRARVERLRGTLAAALRR